MADTDIESRINELQEAAKELSAAHEKFAQISKDATLMATEIGRIDRIEQEMEEMKIQIAQAIAASAEILNLRPMLEKTQQQTAQALAECVELRKLMEIKM